MMTALELRLRQALQPWRTAPAWRIAFSGGLDSSVLLHLLADWARHEDLPPLSAIHVHHGLQPAADAQGQHLQAHAACLLGDYQRARLLWERLAQSGDGEAQLHLGQLAQRRTA